MAEAEEASAAASVLDASALIALLHDEPGAEAVVEAITAGAVVSVVNWAEVLEALSTEDCIAVAELRPLTKALGLSLGDRTCWSWRGGSASLR